MIQKKVNSIGRAMLLLAVTATAQALPSKFAGAASRARSGHQVGATTRAPRPDAPTSPALVAPFDSTILAEIAACCCNLTNIVRECCSTTESIIGSLGDPGICDATLWSTVAGIQNTQQSVIGWLKTIMLELRGLCQPIP